LALSEAIPGGRVRKLDLPAISADATSHSMHPDYLVDRVQQAGNAAIGLFRNFN